MFDNLNNISDELLAAFLDGNTMPEENKLIEDAMSGDEDLIEIANITNDVISFEDKLSVWEGDYGFWELGIDPVFTREELMEENVDGISMEESVLEENLSITDIKSNNVESINNDFNMKVYGEERNYTIDPFDENTWQGYKNTCAIKAQEIILRDYGIMISQEQLMGFAAQNGWYDPGTDFSNPYLLDGGTPMDCVGNLLNACGIETKLIINGNIFDLVSELSQGHRVMVSVDASELWEKGWFAEQKHKFEDIFQIGGNHALVVAGIEVNPEDPTDIHVVLTDPGSGELRVTYEWGKFHGAWEDSKCTLITTTVPAPYQYNAELNIIEPSGFATIFFPSQVQLPSFFLNEFPPLTDEYYSRYSDFNPLYSENNQISVGEKSGEQLNSSNFNFSKTEEEEPDEESYSNSTNNNESAEHEEEGINQSEDEKMTEEGEEEIKSEEDDIEDDISNVDNTCEC